MAVKSSGISNSARLITTAFCEFVSKRGFPVVHLNRGGFASVRTMHTDDDQPVRVLQVGNSVQSATYITGDVSQLVFDYHKGFDLVFAARDLWQPRRVCMIGGAGYSYPKYLMVHHPEVGLSVVENDEAMYRLAVRHFFLDQVTRDTAYVRESLGVDEPSFIIGDGLEVLQQNVKAYDVIFNDAFTGFQADESFKSDQAMEIVKRRLAPEGVYVINVVSALMGDESKPLRETLDLLERHFAHLYLKSYGEDDPFQQDNCVVFASDHPMYMDEVPEMKSIKAEDAEA